MKHLILMSLLSLSVNLVMANEQIVFSPITDPNEACVVKRNLIYVFNHQQKVVWIAESLDDVTAGISAPEAPVRSYLRARCLSCATIQTNSWGDTIDTFNLSRNPNNVDDVILSYSINELNINGQVSTKNGTVECISLKR